MAKKWIQAMHLKKGALHKELGVKAGKKIPAKKLAAATKKGGVEGKRARLAETLKGFHHGGRGAIAPHAHIHNGKGSKGKGKK